ncbi:MAG: mechanosensitive ion channel domain-containing protein [Cyanobacteria bacterium J06621_11]
MNSLFHLIINPYTAAYLLILVGTQALYYQWQNKKRDRLTTQRLTRGLPPNTLASPPAEQLKKRRHSALIEVGLLVITLIVVPVLLVGITHWIERPESAIASTINIHQRGLTLMFLGLLTIAVFGGLQTAKAFVGGLSYKAIAAFSVPFQLGDYVTIKGISGKVVQFNTFFTQLSTLSGQQVSLPTHTLWHEAVTSFNRQASSSQGAYGLSSSRSALLSQAAQCEMIFYLSPTATSEQYKIAEEILLETIRSSAYVEPSGPVEIYCSQTLEAIKFNVTAYVTAVEHSAAFRSEVTRRFLTFTERKQIPLAIK